METYRTCDFPRGWRSGPPAFILIRTCFFFETLFTHQRILTTLHRYIKFARDQSHDIWRLELGKVKYDVFGETQIFVLTNNLRCFDETDLRTSQKTTYAQFKIHRTHFIDEIGPRNMIRHTLSGYIA